MTASKVASEFTIESSHGPIKFSTEEGVIYSKLFSVVRHDLCDLDNQSMRNNRFRWTATPMDTLEAQKVLLSCEELIYPTI